MEKTTKNIGEPFILSYTKNDTINNMNNKYFIEKVHIVETTLVLLYFIIITSPLFSQYGKISGRVYDENGKAIQNIDVLLMLNDTIINGATTDSRGEYSRLVKY